jgi:hypothetical protein
MLVFRWKNVLIACAALLGGITDAQAAEWINFYPITGELSLEFDGRWEESASGNSTRRTDYEERLSLHLGGYSVDPRIFTFNFDLEPALTQQESDSGTATVSSDGTFLNYKARFSLLHGVPASPVSLNADFSADTGETEGSLGNRSDFTTETRGANLHWKFRPFKSTLSYREQSLNVTFIPGFGLTPTERDEFQQTLTYRGKSRGMELVLEGNKFDDRTALDKDYESGLARLTNNFHWGKNSRLTSRLEYSDREGFNAEEKVSVNENLRLQHTENLSTTYGYGYDSLQRTTDTETHSGSFGLNHQLYNNLTTNFGLDGFTTQSDQFREDTYNVNLDFNYTKRFTPGLRLSANLGGGYNTTDRTGGQLDFTESPTIPVTGIVVLVQRFILWPTIVVTAPGCNPCLDGTDYLVEDAGGDFTQLRIPAGSRINIGDTITVDYAYEPPTVEYYGIPYRVGFRLEYGPFAFYHRTVGEDQTFVSGPDPTAIGDRRTDTTGVEWNWTRGRNRVSAGAERVFTETIDRATTEYLLRQTLNYAIAPNATLSATFRETFLRNDTTADAYDGDLSVRWFPFPGLSVTPRLSAFRRTVDPGGTDSFVRAGVDVSWKWRRLAVDMLYDHTQHDNDGATRVEDRVFVKLTRKF